MLISLLLTILAAPPQAGESFSSAEAGFKIQVPVAEWALNTVPGQHGISALAMGPPEHAGVVQFSVQISAATVSDLEGLRTQRDGVMSQVAGVEGIREAKAIEMEISGMKAPGLQVEQDAQGNTYFVRQANLISQGLHYKFQMHAPKDMYKEQEPHFKKALASFEFVKLEGEAVKQAKLRELADRCGSEIDWYTEWDEAAAAAKEQKKLILVSVQAIPGFEIGDQVKRGVFMDLDILRLLQSRFIVLQWRRGMGAPFEHADVFGMGPNTFGNGILVVTPKGDVVRQLFLLKTTAAYDVLIDALKGHPKIDKPTPPADADRQQSIQFYLETGQLDLAKTMLSDTKIPDNTEDRTFECWLKFEYHRLLRDPQMANSALKQAGEASRYVDLPSRIGDDRIMMDSAFMAAVTGKAKNAETMATAIRNSSNATDEVHALALLLLGSLRLQAEDRAGTEEDWMELVDKFPDSRWAWLVAAAMTGPGWGIEIYPDLRWPDQADRKLAFIPKAAPNMSSDISMEELISSANEYLLVNQEREGNWKCMTSYGDRKELADDFELAATAINGSALLRLEDNGLAKEAAGRALNWMIKQRKLLQNEEKPPVVFMDYTVWSRSYCIDFLADCLQHKIGNADAVRAEMKNCIQDLAERQQQNGGWSYYLTTKVGGAATPQSISFTSATVVMALERAVEAGVAVDEEMLKRGLDCMAALRCENGTFAYFLNGADFATSKPASFDIKGSAARGPACALSLIRGGRETFSDLAPRLQMYIDHLPLFGAQRHKALMHAGANAQGSHYLLYDYSTAAEALRAAGKDDLKPKLRNAAYNAILGQIRSCRLHDGSYLDNPLIGVNIGTGLALTALVDLQNIDA